MGLSLPTSSFPDNRPHTAESELDSWPVHTEFAVDNLAFRWSCISIIPPNSRHMSHSFTIDAYWS